MNNDTAPSSSHPSLPTSLPPFTGLFSTHEALRNQVATDFGRAIHRLPLAVLQPKTADDVVQVVQLARQQGLKVAARGLGHSAYGQGQVAGGIVVDMATLNTIGDVHSDHVEVEAGVRLDDLLRATLAHGLTPPLLTDYLGLSLGGVLAVGGVGAGSHRHGALVDHVRELQVVTGEGKLETCSPTQQPELFASVLAGLGQYGIIVRATMELMAAKANARVFRVFYPTLAAMVEDEVKLSQRGDERFDEVLGYIAVTPQDAWGYMLELAVFYTPPTDQPDNAHLLRGLNFLPGLEQIEEMTYSAYRNRVDAVVQAFTALGVWGHPHSWFDVLLPTPVVVDYVSELLAQLSPAESKFDALFLNPFNASHLHMPLLRLPQAETFFGFDMLHTIAPNPEAIAQVVASNRLLFERSRALGGTYYPIGMVEMSQQDWQTQYGPLWEQVVQMKQHFDPDHLFSPGQGIFP
jgi:FAD/FMN-containing dehydrogenase